MPASFILAQSDATAKALEQVLRLRADFSPNEKGEDESNAFGGKLEGKCVYDENEVASPSGVLAAFRRISAVLEQHVSPTSSTDTRCQVIVLIDHVAVRNLDPIKGNGWNKLVAMLILAFPEVRYFFGVCRDEADVHARAIAAGHSLDRLFAPKWEPLFDSTGLRTWVRMKAREVSGTPELVSDLPDGESRVSYLPLRKQIAAAVDDELSYAYFHGYAAYRFGFRSHVITGFEQFAGLFGNKGSGGQGANCDLILDDLFLNFPDREPPTNDALPLSDLRQRADQHPQVSKAKHWILITTGQRRPDDEEKWESNREFLQELKDQGQHNKMLFKPTSGIFDLWKHCGMLSRLPAVDLEGQDEHGVRRGYADGFVWPPPKTAAIHDLNRGHSAPGRMLEISTALINRSERMLKDVASVPEAVHGAVLAADALELIGPRTPTTSLEALSLKHQFEVLAECQFYGVEYDFDLKARFEDIERELRAISFWFNPGTSKLSWLNAELAILSKLVVIFRSNNQFDEEQMCMAKIRELYRRIWVRKKPGAWVLWPVRFYVEWMLKSWRVFALAIVIWIVAIAGLFWVFGVPGYGGDQAILDAVHTFFGGEPPRGWTEHTDNAIAGLSAYKRTFFSVTILAVLAGIVHIGVFIAHVYSLIARR